MSAIGSRRETCSGVTSDGTSQLETVVQSFFHGGDEASDFARAFSHASRAARARRSTSSFRVVDLAVDSEGAAGARISSRTVISELPEALGPRRSTTTVDGPERV